MITDFTMNSHEKFHFEDDYMEDYEDQHFEDSHKDVSIRTRHRGLDLVLEDQPVWQGDEDYDEYEPEFHDDGHYWYPEELETESEPEDKPEPPKQEPTKVLTLQELAEQVIKTRFINEEGLPKLLRLGHWLKK